MNDNDLGKKKKKTKNRDKSVAPNQIKAPCSFKLIADGLGQATFVFETSDTIILGWLF